MLISSKLHKESSGVSIETRSRPASLSFKGQATKHMTIKWSITSVSVLILLSFFWHILCVFTFWPLHFIVHIKRELTKHDTQKTWTGYVMEGLEMQ